MKLGVFDSGIGGEAVAASLRKAFPRATIQVVNDKDNVPYGSKTANQVILLTDAAIQPLLAAKCDIIILACNTATAASIEELRRKYPSQNFIGLEPMIKPAARLTKTGTIAVCATPVTLASKRYQWLIETYAQDTTIIQPDCSNWAHMIETNTIDKAQIEKIITGCLDKRADVIVLGCTHYHWIKELITDITGSHAVVLEPSEAIAQRVKAVMGEANPSSASKVAAVLPANAQA